MLLSGKGTQELQPWPEASAGKTGSQRKLNWTVCVKSGRMKLWWMRMHMGLMFSTSLWALCTRNMVLFFFTFFFFYIFHPNFYFSRRWLSASRSTDKSTECTGRRGRKRESSKLKWGMLKKKKKKKKKSQLLLWAQRSVMTSCFCNTGITIKGIVHPKMKVWSSAHLHVSEDLTMFVQPRNTQVASSCSVTLIPNHFWTHFE